jgi:hypothetical protein
MSIQNLNTGTPTSASLIPFFDTVNGGDRNMSVAQLAVVILASLATGGYVTQYAAPTATGFSVAVNPPTNGQNMFLLISPLAAYAAGTIVLPLASNCIDGQQVLCFTTQAITALTTSLNGASGVVGVPTTLAAAGYFTLRFDLVSKNWYRIA